MDPVRCVNRHSLVRINCRIRVVSWWIVGSSRNISNARITHHQFPTARIPRWKRLAGRECHRIEGGTRLCAGRRSVAHHCRGHSQSQSQSQPLHLSLSIYHPGNIRSISVLLKPESAPIVVFDVGSQPRESVANTGYVGQLLQGRSYLQILFMRRRQTGEIQARARSVESPPTRFRSRR